MGLCVFGHAAMLLGCLQGSQFSLQWTHSVEKTTWVEHYSIHRQRLVQTLVKIKGSGAGIDPAPHARLVDGWYQWAPTQAIVLTSIALANSEKTPDNWMLCTLPAALDCIDLAAFEAQGHGGFVIKPGKP